MRGETVVLRLCLCLGLVLAFLGGLGPTPAAAHSGYWRVDAGAGLNLRAGPGGSYARIATMPNGTLTKAFGHRGNWLKVRYLATGQVGWAWLAYFVQASGPAPSSGGAICLTNHWGEYVCSSEDTGNAIRYWAAHYGVGWWWLAATAACESSFHLGVVNPSSGVTGLFQFEPDTFSAWGGSDIWSAWDQSRIAAKMFAAGEARQYYCAILIGYA